MLESHHWRFAISCIRESGIFDHFSTDEWSQVHGVLCLLCLLLMSASQVRYLIKSLILATDITQQPKVSSRSNRSHQSNPERLPLSLSLSKYLARLKRCLASPATAEATLKMSDPETRLFILKIALKCADLGNPCRSWELSRRWSELICSEFYRQGDFERQLNLPVTPICNRYEASMAKIQTGRRLSG